MVGGRWEVGGGRWEVVGGRYGRATELKGGNVVGKEMRHADQRRRWGTRS